jgi:DNA-binding NarL/FixJ family response regulator
VEEQVPRVLIGDFGAIARLGLQRFRDEEGFEVVAEPGASQGLLDRLAEASPDVVVIDLDEEAASALAAWVASRFPAVKVIACSSREPLMRVYPPFHRGESYVCELSPRLLAEAVRT